MDLIEVFNHQRAWFGRQADLKLEMTEFNQGYLFALKEFEPLIKELENKNK
jgi:hypothetical protein